jgi:hypothetical protein
MRSGGQLADCSAVPRIVFLTPGLEDYLTDSLFHGLRTMLGADVVDFPKLDFLYSSYPQCARSQLYGRGFTLYGLLADIDVDRARVHERALGREFDLVVLADIWRSFGVFAQLGPQLAGRVRIAVLDGSDRPEPYPYAGVWWRRRVWWTLPRAHMRGVYFKRELTSWTGTFRSYLTVPPPFAARLDSVREMREISFSIPEEKILTGAGLPKDRLLASHVVDPHVARRLELPSGYVFSQESDYYADLQRWRFGITTKRAGWDCLRHYEQAANGCVPCFRHLERKPPRCAPHGLDRSNCIAYRSARELLERRARIGQGEYEQLREGASRWARENSTLVRASRFLEQCLGAGT